MFEKEEEEVVLKSLRMTDTHYLKDSTWGYTEVGQKKECMLSREQWERIPKDAIQKRNKN